MIQMRSMLRGSTNAWDVRTIWEFMRKPITKELMVYDEVVYFLM